MKALNLIESKHYLAKRNISINLWELKQDIIKGKLHAKKSNGLYLITDNDLETAYGISQEKLTGKEYYMLRVIQGQSQKEIIQRRLLPQCHGDIKRAERTAAAYEAHITMGTYQKQFEEEADIKKHFVLLGERDGLLKKLAEKSALGLVDEVKKIQEQMQKREAIFCKIKQTYTGLEIQLPITHEKQKELGLYKSLRDFFSSQSFYTKLFEREIRAAMTVKDGYLTLDCAGKPYQILNTLNEHLASAQPQGFPEARLEARVYVPPQLTKEKRLQKEMRKQPGGERIREIRPEEIYTRGEIVKMYNLGYHPQAVAGLTKRKIIAPVIKSGRRYYRVIVPSDQVK